jgi:predicted ester cyclase
MRAMLYMFATGDLSSLQDVVAAAYVDHQDNEGLLVLGPEGFATLVSLVRRRFPDLRVQIDDLLQEGDRVVVRLTWRGCDQARPFEAHSIDVVRFASGLAVEHWGVSAGWP